MPSLTWATSGLNSFMNLGVCAGERKEERGRALHFRSTVRRFRRCRSDYHLDRETPEWLLNGIGYVLAFVMIASVTWILQRVFSFGGLD